MVQTNSSQNFYTYLVINFMLFGLIVLLSKNYLFQAIDWLLALININHALYISAIVFYFIAIFLLKTFLIGSFTNANYDNTQDSLYLATSILALVVYIVVDNMFLQTNYPTYSLLV